MSTVTEETTQVSESERRANRKEVHGQIAELQKKAATGLQLGRDMAGNKKRILELKILAEEAVILGRDCGTLDTERRRLEDLVAHQRASWQKVSGAQGEIAALETQLRGALACPKLRAETFIARRAFEWAGKRQAAAEDQLRTATGSSDEILWQAEAEHASQLVNETALDVERLKRTLVDE